MKRKLAILSLFLICANLFASAKGFTSVHSGFGWWIGAIALTIPHYVIIGFCFVLGGERGYTSFNIISLILGIVFIFGGFLIYPTVWCGFLGGILGILISLCCLFAFLIDADKELLLPNLICIILTIIAIIIYCINSSGHHTVLITYAIAIFGALISNGICALISYLNKTTYQRNERRNQRRYENDRKAILDNQTKNNNYLDTKTELAEIDNLIKNISDDILQIEMMQNKSEIDIRCIGNLENHVVEIMKHKKNFTPVTVKSLRMNKNVIRTILRSSKKKLPLSTQVRIKGILQLLKV